MIRRKCTAVTIATGPANETLRSTSQDSHLCEACRAAVDPQVRRGQDRDPRASSVATGRCRIGYGLIGLIRTADGLRSSSPVIDRTGDYRASTNELVSMPAMVRSAGAWAWWAKSSISRRMVVAGGLGCWPRERWAAVRARMRSEMLGSRR